MSAVNPKSVKVITVMRSYFREEVAARKIKTERRQKRIIKMRVSDVFIPLISLGDQSKRKWNSFQAQIKHDNFPSFMEKKPCIHL